MARRILDTSPNCLPIVWEKGGMNGIWGSATIIASPEGLPLVPIYIPKQGKLSCANHAAFQAQENMIVIEAEFVGEDLYIWVYRIQDIIQNQEGEWEADFVLLAKLINGEWDNITIARKYSDAILAAKDKVVCYECSEPHYYRNL